MSPPQTLNYVSLYDAVASGLLLEADALQFRGKGLISPLIKTGGRGEHTHSGMATFNYGTPMCSEVREFRGGRNVTLASQVRRYQGLIDVYTANADGRWDGVFDRERAAAYMVKMAGCDYDYGSVVLAGLNRLTIFRAIASRMPQYGKRMRSDDTEGRGFDKPAFCSMAVDMAYFYGGGVDVVKELDSRLTEPCDITRSPFFSYACTLV